MPGITTRLLRARVTERLARAARFPITLVVAPAGFGKTVALRDFLATERVDAVRYDVAREDRTLAAFARGLSAALEPVAPGAAASFPAVQQRIAAAADPVGELASWLGEHLKRVVCTVVIDDLHYAAADPDAVRLLVALVEATESRIRWILAMRSDAGLPVASWLGYGRMDVPIGEDDLRFTPPEALAAADDAAVATDAGEVEALRELTAGWPIALAIALRTRTHAADLRAAATGTREMIYRYLAEQVFAGLTRAQQRFLLATSVFPHFDDTLAAELGATPEFLETLRASVTFIATSTSSAYRYHDLFREFLERELRRSGAQAWHDAHVVGGELLERTSGDDAGALALYTKVGAVDAILALLERAAIALFDHGESDALAAALEAVPDARRSANAGVLAVRAMLDANRGSFEIAERSFTRAIALAEGERRVTLVHRYALELVRHDGDAVTLLEPYARDRTLAAALRVPILGTLATAYARGGRVRDALDTIRTALDGADAVPDDARARLFQQAAFTYQYAPTHERVRAYATRAIEIATARGLYETAARAYSVLYTIVSDEDDDPIGALAILDKLDESARKSASRQARAFALVVRYAVEVERGDDAALEQLDPESAEAREAPAATRAQALLPAEALRAAWSGDFGRAHDLLAGTSASQVSDERRGLRAAEIALYAAAAGRGDEADAAARDASAALDGCTHVSPRIVRARLTLALAELVRGRASLANRRLSEAERALAPAMRRLRALAAAVRAAYRVALAQAEPPALAAALERLRAEHFGGLARVIAALPSAAAEEPGLAQLTTSEREILRLLARGASTKDVAAQTGRSPQTVDTHIRSICRKLNCSGRREAVAIATGAGWVTV